MIARLIIYCFVALFSSAVLSANPKTVVWILSPDYEAVKPYSQDLYLCQLNGKWGMVDADGRTILPNKYDFITSLRGGIGLFGVVEGGRNRLEGFVNSVGTCTEIKGTYYVIPEFSYFSEGKLCVSDQSGRQGFVDESGNIAVKCRFDAVRPFKEGLASVKKGKWVYYIRENYDADPDQNVVYSQWRNGRVTVGSSFKYGEAVVGYGDKYRVIDTQGSELRVFSASDWKINPLDYTIAYSDVDSQTESFSPQYSSSIEVFPKDGKYGFRLDGEEILPPVLNSASLVDLNQVSIAVCNGKTGLLKIIDGSVKSSLLRNGRTAEYVYAGENSKASELQYVISVPEQWVGHTRLLADNGNGNFEEVSSFVAANRNELRYSFYPEVGSKDKSVNLKYRLLYEGMEVLSEEFTLSVKKAVRRLRLSAPSTTTAQADIRTELQDVSATVFNDSEQAVTVTATLSVDCQSNKSVSRSYNITIPGRSSKTVSVSVLVTTDENATAVIRLSSGETKKSVVALQIY